MPLLLTEASLKTRVKELFLLFILYVSVRIGLTLIIQHLLINWTIGMINVIFSPLKYLVLFTIGYLIIRRPIALIQRSSVKTYVKALLFTFGLLFLASAINLLIDSYITGDWKEKVEYGFTKYEMLFLAVILAPIVEELFFRGIILSQLLLVFNKNQWVAIVVGGLFFGAIHSEPSQILFNCIVGIGYCFLYWKTKNITITMFCHCMQNLIVFTARYYMFTPD